MIPQTKDLKAGASGAEGRLVQVKMRRERGFRTEAQGGVVLAILRAIQPNDFDTDIPEDAACLAFCAFDGRRRNRRRVEHRDPKLD